MKLNHETVLALTVIAVVGSQLASALIDDSPQVYKWDMRYVEDVDVSLNNVESPVWNFNSASISDDVYNITAYRYADSVLVSEDGVLANFRILGDTLLLRSAENRLFKVQFDSTAMMLITDSLSVASLNGEGLYCDHLKLKADGYILREPNIKGKVTIDGDTLDNVKFNRYISEFNPRIVNVDASQLDDIRIKSEVYQWFIDGSDSPIARHIKRSYISACDTTNISSITVLANCSSIDDLLQNDGDKSLLKAKAFNSYSVSSSLPDGLSVNVSIGSAYDELTMHIVNDSTCESKVDIDVYNTLGQRVSPTIHKMVSMGNTSMNIALLPSNVSTYIIVVRSADQIKVYKVSR
jgi:hypothetical protein